MDESSGGIPPDSDNETDAEIKAAIDEAVQAVEEVERRREAEVISVADEAAADGEVEALRAELDVLRDRSLRTLADFDNYRKRADRDREEDRKYAANDVLREFLGTVDNLQRAISAEGSLDDLKQGVDMILRQMEDSLRRSGVTRVEAVGRPFDPSVHEAVSRVEDESVEDPTVIDEFQAGYVVHERLLRPAVVRVAVPPIEVAGDREDESSPRADGDGDEESGEATN